jgi:hypothetical protein
MPRRCLNSMFGRRDLEADLTANGLIERIADGHTDLVWGYVAQSLLPLRKRVAAVAARAWLRVSVRDGRSRETSRTRVQQAWASVLETRGN